MTEETRIEIPKSDYYEIAALAQKDGETPQAKLEQIIKKGIVKLHRKEKRAQ